MATICLRLVLAGTLFALPAASLFAQRGPTESRRRPPSKTRAAPNASDQPIATAKLRADTPGQDDDPAAPAFVRGAVRAASGEPVLGATVWLVTRRGDEFDRPLVASTDANGRFSFPDVDEPTLFGGGDQTAVVMARDADGRLGWFELRRGFSTGAEVVGGGRWTI